MAWMETDSRSERLFCFVVLGVYMIPVYYLVSSPAFLAYDPKTVGMVLGGLTVLTIVAIVGVWTLPIWGPLALWLVLLYMLIRFIKFAWVG